MTMKIIYSSIRCYLKKEVNSYFIIAKTIYNKCQLLGLLVLRVNIEWHLEAIVLTGTQTSVISGLTFRRDVYIYSSHSGLSVDQWFHEPYSGQTW